MALTKTDLKKVREAGKAVIRRAYGEKGDAPIVWGRGLGFSDWWDVGSGLQFQLEDQDPATLAEGLAIVEEWEALKREEGGWFK